MSDSYVRLIKHILIPLRLLLPLVLIYYINEITILSMKNITGTEIVTNWLIRHGKTEVWLADQLGVQQPTVWIGLHRRDRVPLPWIHKLEKIDPCELHRTKTRPDLFAGLEANEERRTA